MSAQAGIAIGRFEAPDEEDVVALWAEVFGAYHPSNEPRAYLARKLAYDAELVLVARGCPKINLQVRADNLEVVAFYKHLGYELEERANFGRRFV